MIDLSQRQLLKLWPELDDALYGKNGFGADTAEIYAYTVLPADPSADSASPAAMREEARRENALQAARTLHAVLVLFSEIRDCVITVDDDRLGKWMLTWEFEHRVHITVRKKDVRGKNRVGK
jgi:hypothetical protein